MDMIEIKTGKNDYQLYYLIYKIDRIEFGTVGNGGFSADGFLSMDVDFSRDEHIQLMVNELEELHQFGHEPEHVKFYSGGDVCSYCGHRSTTDNDVGYVPQYNAYVCEDCYNNHHGPAC